MMLQVHEALSMVMAEAKARPARRCPVGESVGCILAEAVVSDVDSPPHDKALMDGYALRSSDASSVELLDVLEEITAGAVPTQPVRSGTASRIMTGAPVPEGADAVVMVEQTELVDGRVRITANTVEPEQNILHRAAAMSIGETLLPAGRQIRAHDVGLLCEAGCVEPAVIPQPEVALVSTGNELVDPAATPAAGQIRNSNGYMLDALARKYQARPINLGIARDDPATLHALIEQGLQADVLVLSGGVSAGVLDLVPATLQACGVEEVFHKIQLKPGKPLWFGVRRATPSTLVFGLPGNPVSSLVCFELFVRPALDALAGREVAPPELKAALAHPWQHRGGRPTYFPASLAEGRVTLLPWKGSADQRTLSEANCLCLLPAEPREFQAEDEVVVRLLG